MTLSQSITKKFDLRKLALHGLNMKSSEIERHLANESYDISEAAYQLLVEWRNSQDDECTAYIKIQNALASAELSYLKMKLIV